MASASIVLYLLLDWSGGRSEAANESVVSITPLLGSIEEPSLYLCLWAAIESGPE